MVAACDLHAARLVFQNASVLIADSARVTRARSALVAARRSTGYVLLAPPRPLGLNPPPASDITRAVITDLATPQIRYRRVLAWLIREYERAA
jgi:hypothetical protein